MKKFHAFTHVICIRFFQYKFYKHYFHVFMIQQTLHFSKK